MQSVEKVLNTGEIEIEILAMEAKKLIEPCSRCNNECRHGEIPSLYVIKLNIPGNS